MKIALLAPLWKEVPPEKYGGTELVVANLARGLSERGHEVTTFASGGSRVEGKLVRLTTRPMFDLVEGYDWSGVKPYEFLSFFELGKRMGDFDIVHNHNGFHPISLAPFLPVPLITTLHSSAPPGHFSCLAKAFRKYPFVSISDAQRRLEPRLNYVATIHHGIDVDFFRPRLKGKGKGFLFLGMISQHKGVDIAIEMARKLQVPLTIAGRVENDYCPFLCKKFFPYIDGKLIRYVGEADQKRKAELLAESDALFFTSRWEEAFGLVMVEALACGTPVIALNNGAVPEVLREGVTGVMARSKTSFVEAAQKVSTLSRAACRKDAEERFDYRTMTAKYEELYASILENK